MPGSKWWFAGFVFAVLVVLPRWCFGQGRSVQGPPPVRTVLPTDHPYQKALRAHLATYVEADFAHGVTGGLTLQPPGSDDPEDQYRHYLLTLMQQPLVGTKRGVPAVNAPAALFLLSAIEQPDGVHALPVYPEALVTFTHWKFAGNPYYQNRALQRRAFVAATVHMLMLDHSLEHHPESCGCRSDWLGSHLILLAHPYPGFRDELPGDVRTAYETGLRKMGERVLGWGPEGEEPNLEITAALGLWYISRAIRNEEFTQRAKEYARRLCTDPRYFHPAGFFLDQTGIDIGYQGMTNFFSTGLALASDWPFVKEAVARCYRLKAHLVFPEPDGKYVGPSHFNSRTGSDAWGDQWEWGLARDSIAALATTEAAFMTKFPTPAELAGAANARAGDFNHNLKENPRGEKGFIANEEIRSHPWKWRLWQSFNFPATINFGYEHYPAGALARAKKLRDDNSPWLKSPYLREELFTRNFENAFISTRQKNYAAVLQTGPIGHLGLEDGGFKFPGALGFGGGQLSGFWTPATGAVILGRRAGNSWDKVFDALEEWHNWPLHAVSGSKSNGKIFTSARLRQPRVTTDPAAPGRVLVEGPLPIEQLGQGKVLEGRIDFSRRFDLDADRVRIETRLVSTGQDKLTELFETIPVFHRDSARQGKTLETKIEFQTGATWSDATDTYRDGVTAIRLSRFDGAVRITFDAPQRVKLSPAVWTDTFLSRATCRNVVIDLLGDAPEGRVFRGEKSTRYHIAAEAKE